LVHSILSKFVPNEFLCSALSVPCILEHFDISIYALSQSHQYLMLVVEYAVCWRRITTHQHYVQLLQGKCDMYWSWCHLYACMLDCVWLGSLINTLSYQDLDTVYYHDASVVDCHVKSIICLRGYVGNCT